MLFLSKQFSIQGSCTCVGRALIQLTRENLKIGYDPKDQLTVSNTEKYAGETGCVEVEYRKSSTLKRVYG